MIPGESLGKFGHACSVKFEKADHIISVEGTVYLVFGHACSNSGREFGKLST